MEGGPEIRRAAEAIRRMHEAGRGIVVVVSALKGLTDKLLSAVESISPETPPDVTDHIIGLGEEQSVRLMTAALRALGVDAVEVTPSTPSWPIVTDETHGNAEPILEECRSRVELGLRPLIKRGKIPVVCGFVGRSPSGKTTTLGRGGGDTTAVLMARCLGADELVLVKDVDGVYSADPSKVEDAAPIDALGAWEAYLLASAGAKVLQGKAFRYKPDELTMRIVSREGALGEGGTVVRGVLPRLEVEIYERPVLRVVVVGDVASQPEALTRFCREIQEKGGRVLSLTVERSAVTFCVDGGPLEVLRGVHAVVKAADPLKAVSASENLALVTVWGTGLDDAARLMGKVVGPLASRGIDVHGAMVGPSSIGILVDWEMRGEAARVIGESLGGA